MARASRSRARPSHGGVPAAGPGPGPAAGAGGGGVDLQERSGEEIARHGVWLYGDRFLQVRDGLFELVPRVLQVSETGVSHCLVRVQPQGLAKILLGIGGALRAGVPEEVPERRQDLVPSQRAPANRALVRRRGRGGAPRPLSDPQREKAVAADVLGHFLLQPIERRP